ncbi:hypothetical protein [Streptomyces decoyicus]|uniref:hypothetical protein n=1 Tax=Streptomyces decoyicus TaxID=249567 RepID=UPI002F90F195
MAAQPALTNEQIDAYRKRLSATDVEPGELREIALRLLADNDEWYSRADHWRESYRLAAGMTDDELNARIAIDEATKRHPRPCPFPESPDCSCPGD